MELPRLIKVELVKLFMKRSTWIATLLVVFMPIVIFLYFIITGTPDMGVSGFSLIRFSLQLGKTLASLIVVIVSVGIVCGEAKDRTLRASLTKPVSRENVLLSKFIAILIYIMALLLAVGIGGALAGIKWGFQPEESTVRQEVGRLALNWLLYVLELCVVASFSFLVSVLTDSPTLAYIVGLAFNFSDFIQTAFDKIAPYTYPFHRDKAMEAIYGTFFSTAIDWRLLQKSLGVIGIYILAFLLIATIIFERKDIKV